MADPGRGGTSEKPTTCGVLVTDGTRLLLGHASRSPRWDIPKGMAEPGESHIDAAVRELREETGLRAPADELLPLGVRAYLRTKDLALFEWRRDPMPDLASLACTSWIALPGGGCMPEMDRFGVFAWAEALSLVGESLARVLAAVRP